MSDSSPEEGPVAWDEHILAERLQGHLRVLEEFRRKVVAKRRKGWLWISVSLLVAVLLTLGIAALSGGSTPPVAMAFPAIGFIVAALIIRAKYFGDGAEVYRQEYKKRIIGGMTEAVSPGMSYRPERGLPEDWFNSSGLYSSPDRYAAEDLFEGRIGKTQIWLSEVHAEERRTRQDSKGRSQTYYVTIFSGLFVVADFHKNFRSELAVLPDVAERNFGWFGRKLQKLGGHVQRMENPDFERAFVVRGHDAVEARYILTPDMQERMLSLRQRLGDDVRFAFKESHVFMMFSNDADWFEPDMNVPADHRHQMRGFLGQMACCFNVVEDLNLNTRIWTKE